MLHRINRFVKIVFRKNHILLKIISLDGMQSMAT